MIEKLTIDSLDLRPKLILAFVLVAALVAVTGAIGYMSVGAVDEEAHVIAEDGEKMDAAAELIVAVEQQQEAVLAAQLGASDAQQEFEAANELFDEQAQKLESASLSADQQAEFSAIKSQHEEYNALGEEFFGAVEAGDDASAERTAGEMESLGTSMEENAHSIEQSAQADLDKQVAAADQTTENAQIEIIGLTIGAFVVAIAIGLFVSRRIMTPVSQLSDAARAASEGDLDTDLDEHVESDELGRMVEAFETMQTNLRGVFAELEAVSRNLETGELDRDLETDYPGTYGEIMRSLDSGTDQLTASFEEIQQASDDLEHGRLEQ